MANNVSITYRNNKKKIKIIKIEKEVLKILLLINIMSMESKKKNLNDMKRNLYLIKHAIEGFRKKITLKRCLVGGETDMDLEFVFFVLRLIGDMFEYKNVKIRAFGTESCSNKSVGNDNFRYKKKNHSIKNSIQTATNILNEEILKITEINLQLQYFESSICSINSIQSNLKHIVNEFQKNKRHTTGNYLNSFENIFLINIAIFLLVLTIWFMININ